MSGRARVLIRPAEYDDKTLDRVVEEIFDSFACKIDGQKVLVKPNMLSGRPPERAVTTHPSVVAAVVRALERRRAGEIMVGDNPGMRHYGDSSEVAAATGILDVARPYFRNLGQSPRRIRMHNPYAGEVVISGEVLECDVLVTLPKFKTHSLTALTCAVKNSYGFLLGAEKARLHRVARSAEAFAGVVVAVWALRRPDVAIVDAVSAMQGNGPSSRDIFHYGRLLASDDSVALDAVAGALMGLRPDEVKTTVEAARRGLGQADLDKIDIDGPFKAIEGFKLPMTMGRGRFAQIVSGLAGGLFISRPRPDINECVRCKLCMEHCPTSAIRMDPYPVISHKKCIRCYCCLEFCPVEAMKLSRRVSLFRKIGR